MATPGSSTAAADSSRGRSKAAADGRRFQRELRSMMYGAGDDRQPQSESVELLEEMVEDYVRDILQQAQEACEYRLRSSGKADDAKIRDRDLLFVLRKQRRKHERAIELLEVWKEVKAARGTVDENALF